MCAVVVRKSTSLTSFTLHPSAVLASCPENLIFLRSTRAADHSIDMLSVVTQIQERVTFYLHISVLNIFSSTLIQKNDIVWGSQECDVPPAFQVKQSAKVAWRVVGYQSYPQAKP